MKVINQTFILICALIIGGCAATGDVMVLTNEKADGDKHIALQAPALPWVLEIQKRLIDRGFKVERWASTRVVTQQTSSTTSEQFNEANARYVAIIEGAAPLDWTRRCFGGGYDFSYISVDVVDTKFNQTLLNVNGSGYSEGCAPSSGTIFGDITDAIDSLWLTDN